MKKVVESVGGCDRFLPMKSASLKIKTVVVNELNKDCVYTGNQLCLPNSKYVPVGFFRNTNKSFKGIVFRDVNGNCTYFDRTHGLVYPMTSEVWCETTFNFIPEMKSLSIGFSTEKKSKEREKVG